VTTLIPGHGDVYEVKSGAVWTVPRVSTPNDSNLTENLGGNKEGRRPLKEELAAEEAAARAKEAAATFAKVKADAIAAAEGGDDDAKDAPAPAAATPAEGEEGEEAEEEAAPAPKMSVDEASTLFDEATKAAEEAAAAAVTARAESTATNIAMRHRLIELIISVIRLPPSAVTAYARRLAMSMAWNICARSTAARREIVSAGLIDALEECACGGGELATVEVTTLAAAVMESLLLYDEVAKFVGGPDRLAHTALHLVASDLPQEQERGARGLAFITSFHDLSSVKSDLLQKNALALLLRLLVPDETESVSGGGGEGGEGEGEQLSHSEITEVRRCAELFAAGALLNLSTLPAAQTALAKRGLYTLLKANSSPLVGRRHVSIGEGDMTGGQMIAGAIQNVACHPENRTRFYKLELRAKSMERVLHNKRMTRHLGRHMDQAGRLVGESFERASARGVKYEVATRRRKPAESEAGGESPGGKGLKSGGSERMPRESSMMGTAMELPPLLTEVLSERKSRKVGLYTLNPVVTYSLKEPGLNP
jgi:hypothetical protein